MSSQCINCCLGPEYDQFCPIKYVCNNCDNNYVIVLIRVITFDFQTSTDFDQEFPPRLSSPAVTVITVAGKDVPSSSRPQPDIPARPETSTTSVPVIAAQPPCSYVPVAPAPFDDHTFGPKVCLCMKSNGDPPPPPPPRPVANISDVFHKQVAITVSLQ